MTAPSQTSKHDGKAPDQKGTQPQLAKPTGLSSYLTAATQFLKPSRK
ncbi:MAG: hypothetical protein AAGJ34_12775 [Pseudomonadota bacterium]